jgi:hypothetical protein
MNPNKLYSPIVSHTDEIRHSLNTCCLCVPAFLGIDQDDRRQPSQIILKCAENWSIVASFSFPGLFMNRSYP